MLILIHLLRPMRHQRSDIGTVNFVSIGYLQLVTLHIQILHLQWKLINAHNFLVIFYPIHCVVIQSGHRDIAFTNFSPEVGD